VNICCWISLAAARAHGLRLALSGTQNRLVAGWEPHDLQLHRDGPYNLYQKPVNGVRDEEFCSPPARTSGPRVGCATRRFLLYTVAHPKTRSDIWVLQLEGDATPVPFLITESTNARLGFLRTAIGWPTPRNESGQDEVYVRSSP